MSFIAIMRFRDCVIRFYCIATLANNDNNQKCTYIIGLLECRIVKHSEVVNAAVDASKINGTFIVNCRFQLRKSLWKRERERERERDAPFLAHMYSYVAAYVRTPPPQAAPISWKSSFTLAGQSWDDVQ